MTGILTGTKNQQLWRSVTVARNDSCGYVAYCIQKFGYGEQLQFKEGMLKSRFKKNCKQYEFLCYYCLISAGWPLSSQS